MEKTRNASICRHCFQTFRPWCTILVVSFQYFNKSSCVCVPGTCTRTEHESEQIGKIEGKEAGREAERREDERKSTGTEPEIHDKSDAPAVIRPDIPASVETTPKTIPVSTP